jgi:cyclopropane fatty-acyl-phospholipid synthase-like methyltransferase
MSLVYRIMYGVGFTPWDTGEVPAALRALTEGSDALPPGRALDIGCGTGAQSVYLAQRGWRVTGVDVVDRALTRARARAKAAAVTVDWLQADVADLGKVGLEPGYTLLFDRGCFHGLTDEERAAYAGAVTALSDSGATLLMMAFAPNRVPVAPRGVDQLEVAARFEGWTLAAAEPDPDPGPPGPLRNVPITWYRLVRG